MTPTTDGPTRRPGFTLLELLMVVAIIGILAALLIGAVNKVRDVAKKTTTTSDIAQLDTVLTQFKKDFNVPPATYVLWTNGSQQVLPRRFRMPVDLTSPEAQFLKRMFPRWAPLTLSDGVNIDLTRMNTYTVGPGGASAAGQPDPLYHPEYVELVKITNPAAQQSGNSSAPAPYAGPNPTSPVAQGLDPNQMIVLLLSGPLALFQNVNYSPLNPALGSSPPGGAPALGLGWAPDGPYAPLASAQSKKGPFYDFPSDRLVSALGPPAGSITAQFNGNLLAQFVDPWGTPYAFFSATAGDAYDSRVMFPWTTDPADTNATLTYNPESDPNAPTAGNQQKGTYTVFPYRSAGKWLNAGKVQIISAGPNKQFGPGSPIVATATATAAGIPSGSKLLYPYTPPGMQPGQYVLLLWEQGQIALHPYYSEKTRGEDDITNLNGGSPMGTSTAP